MILLKRENINKQTAEHEKSRDKEYQNVRFTDLSSISNIRENTVRFHKLVYRALV